MAADYDAILKDLFQRDQPSIWSSLTGGIPVAQILSPEFQELQLRRADLVVRLQNGVSLHVEFQSENDKDMAFRMGRYCLLIGQRYRRPVQQVVLYVGEARMNMQDYLDLGGTKVSYRLMDIREFRAEKLLEGGSAGDLALAMLAAGGKEKLDDIALRACNLGGLERNRVLTQMVLLSGLRRVSGS